MIIKEIVINNFKSLDDYTIKLRGVTILAGGNSVGKSSTIQCLLLVRCLVEKIISKNLQNTSGQVSLPLNGPYMLSLGSTKEAISWETGRSFSIQLISDEAPLLFEFEAESLEITDFFVQAKFPSISDRQLNIISENLYYLNAERLGPRIRHWVNENPSNIHCGYQGQYTIEVLARKGNEPIELSPLKYLRGEQLAGQQTLLKYIQQWLTYVIPNTNLDNAEILGNIRSASVSYNSFFTAPNIGFGVSYVLPIIVTALMAENKSIVIIENPEAHLHPKGQSRIGYFLGCMALTGTQIFIETHSEHVINGFRLACVERKEFDVRNLLINFYHESEDSRKLHLHELWVNDHGDLSDFPYDFFDQSQQDLLQIMKLGRIDG